MQQPGFFSRWPSPFPVSASTSRLGSLINISLDTKIMFLCLVQVIYIQNWALWRPCWIFSPIWFLFVPVDGQPHKHRLRHLDLVFIGSLLTIMCFLFDGLLGYKTCLLGQYFFAFFGLRTPHWKFSNLEKEIIFH